jgi:hypothetical protein
MLRKSVGETCGHRDLTVFNSLDPTGLSLCEESLTIVRISCPETTPWLFFNKNCFFL